MKILGISGSLRRDSHNTQLLRAAARLLPPGAELEVFDGLGHLFFWEQPERSADLLIKHALS
jgi:chromate reductase